jgi:3-oxoacyl-[acyl-carrier-protein] synthase III
MLSAVRSPPTPVLQRGNRSPSMLVTDEQVNHRMREGASQAKPQAAAIITGSALALGSRVVPSADVDRAFGMPVGKLRERAGIESLAYAVDGETEVTLGAQAANRAQQAADCRVDEIDSIIATSETHHLYPSLAAQLHSEIGARETCGAFDVGGACLGLINALSVAQAQIVSGQARTVAVVSSDLHSRTLVPGRVAGEFGGLFGDGASAFLLRTANTNTNANDADTGAERSMAIAAGGKSASVAYRIRDFIFGCADQYAEAVKVEGKPDGSLAVVFEGEALSRAAISRLEKIIAALEKLSSVPRAAVGAFATHQPNPRLLTLLAKVAGVSAGAFPPVATTSGNLGSSTCGAALHCALQLFRGCPESARKPIFLASLGPGLVFGGAWLSPSEG